MVSIPALACLQIAPHDNGYRKWLPNKEKFGHNAIANKHPGLHDVCFKGVPLELHQYVAITCDKDKKVHSVSLHVALTTCPLDSAAMVCGGKRKKVEEKV